MRPTLPILTATLALASVAEAQPQGPIIGGGFIHQHEIEPVPLCDKFYVDPVNGSDANPGTLAMPLRTLTTAMFVATTPSTIILLPGLYAPSTNGEFWPLIVREDVSVQGTNMLNTVLDGEGSDVIWVNSNSDDEDFEDTLYDGFTIKGADVAVRFVSEFWAACPTFANMQVVQNNTGFEFFEIDLGPDASPDDRNNDGFIEFRPRIVNLTISDNGIGILDWSNSFPTQGFSEPCIVNTVIYQNTFSDLEGIDGTDLLRSAFCTFDAAGISQIQGGKPAPVSAVALCNVNPDTIFVSRVTGDYRQLPFSPLLEQGTTTGLVCHGSDVVQTVFPCNERIFDADGEEYCNPRIVGVIDIGADEQDNQIVAGYAPWTTDFNPAFPTLFLYMNTTLAPPLTAATLFGVPTNTAYLRWLPTSVPGARPAGTTIPTPRPPFGLLCIAPATLRPIVNIPIPGPGIPAVINLAPVAADTRFNTQVIPIGSNGVGQLGNLQSFLIRP